MTGLPVRSLGIIKEIKECEQCVVWLVPSRPGRWGGDAREGFLFQAQIGMHVDLRGLDGFVPEPKRDHRLIDTVIKQFHCRAVSENMQTGLTRFRRRLDKRLTQLRFVDGSSRFVRSSVRFGRFVRSFRRPSASVSFGPVRSSSFVRFRARTVG